MSLLKKSLIAPSLAIFLATNLYSANYTVDTTNATKAIEKISELSNIPFIVDTNILKGKKTNKIENIDNLNEALKFMFDGTGLEAVVRNNTIVIKKIEGQGTVLEPISVNTGKSGSAENGYLVDETSNIGPWRGKSIQDTPVSINVITEDLIQNLQATSTDQIYNINPTVQKRDSYKNESMGNVILRGFESRTVAYDGMKTPMFSHNLDVEEYERIETITGLSGFLYGANNVGGFRNFISKRPTSKAQHSITVGNAGGTSGYYTHIDLGGPLTEDGKLGYRLNVISQDNDTHIENQHIERQVINLAFDYKPTDNLLLQALVSDSDYKLDGTQATWSLATGAKRPDASTIDSNKLWGQQWTKRYSEARRYNINALWNINDNIDFRTASLREETKRKMGLPFNTIEADGTYSQIAYNSDDEESSYSNSAYAFLDFDFDTGSINHQLTTGMQMSERYWTTQSSDWSNVSVTGTFDSPTYVSPPKASVLGSKDKEPKTKNTNFSVGDSITFNEDWSLIAGASYVELETTEGVKTDEITPSVSLLYKPIENLTLYTSYMEALEQGGKANDKYNGYNVTNAKQQMDPLMSDQIEVGAKLTLGNTLLTAAYFEIDKGLQYYDASDITKPKYVQDGRQVHKGFEFTATGKLTDNLTALGGFTMLDAKVKKQKQNPLLEGKRPINVADNFVKLFLEYTPFNNMDFAINGGANYTGSFYGDNLNTDKVDSYTIFDLGARYTTKATIYPLTFRINVNNLTDEEYWVSGDFLGDRRTVHASVQMKF